MRQHPVALVAYNRPEHTSQVLDALRRFEVPLLYVFCDGPKEEDADIEKVQETRELLTEIEWTNPIIVPSRKNLGLAKSIVRAASYVLERHDTVILLEDDCVPQKYFFNFIHKCLEKYEGDERIFGVTGYSVTLPDEILKDYPWDVYFFPRIGSWGWATWKRAWQYISPDLDLMYKEAMRRGIDLGLGGKDVIEITKNLIRAPGRQRDVWTMNWILSVYLRGGIYVYPTKSHIKNIGFDGTGVHSSKGIGKTFDSKVAEKEPTRFLDDPIICNPISQRLGKIYGGIDIPKTLGGERDVERTFIEKKLRKGTGIAFELGPDYRGLIAQVALERGYHVDSMGLEEMHFSHKNFTYKKADFLTAEFGKEKFPAIIAVSTIEHMGLERYPGEKSYRPSADLKTMKKLWGMLADDGLLYLTIPVGQDATVGKWHRVYGRRRLPELLNGWEIVEEEYWHKTGKSDYYARTDRDTAFNTYASAGPQFYYALGQFVLRKGTMREQVGEIEQIRHDYYCCIVDQVYLPQFAVFHSSLEEHCKPYHLFVLAMDQKTQETLEFANLQSVTVCALKDVEDADSIQARGDGRKWVEYIWTLKPTLVLHLLKTYPGLPSMAYSDVDVAFHSHPAPVFEEIGDAPLAVVPHRFSPDHRHLITYGEFNGGFVYFQNSPDGLDALNNWRNLCNEWCREIYDSKKPWRFTDQLYLSALVEEFRGHIIQNIGFWVAPWNQKQYGYKIKDDGTTLVNGKRLIAFHYHHHEIGDGTGNFRGYPLHPIVEKRICQAYTARILWGADQMQAWSSPPLIKEPAPEKKRAPKEKKGPPAPSAEPPPSPLPMSKELERWLAALEGHDVDELTVESLMILAKAVENFAPKTVIDIVSGQGLSLRVWLKTRSPSTDVVAVGQRLTTITHAWGKFPFPLQSFRWTSGTPRHTDFRALWAGRPVLLCCTTLDVDLARTIMETAVRELPSGSVVILNEQMINTAAVRNRIPNQAEDILRQDGLYIFRV